MVVIPLRYLILDGNKNILLVHICQPSPHPVLSAFCARSEEYEARCSVESRTNQVFSESLGKLSYSWVLFLG